jgi:hypothetical protein
MRYILAFLLGFAIMSIGMKVRAADLALPKKPAERCLTPGENPSPGQTLHTDKSCKSGMRWVFQK